MYGPLWQVGRLWHRNHSKLLLDYCSGLSSPVLCDGWIELIFALFWPSCSLSRYWFVPSNFTSQSEFVPLISLASDPGYALTTRLPCAFNCLSVRSFKRPLGSPILYLPSVRSFCSTVTFHPPCCSIIRNICLRLQAFKATMPVLFCVSEIVIDKLSYFVFAYH